MKWNTCHLDTGCTQQNQSPPCTYQLHTQSSIHHRFESILVCKRILQQQHLLIETTYSLDISCILWIHSHPCKCPLSTPHTPTLCSPHCTRRRTPPCFQAASWRCRDTRSRLPTPRHSCTCPHHTQSILMPSLCSLQHTYHTMQSLVLKSSSLLGMASSYHFQSSPCRCRSCMLHTCRRRAL